MQRTPSPFRAGATTALFAASLLTLAGCAVTAAEIAELDPRPGLADVRVIGPKGRKCFDFCGSQEAGCKHMCPSGGDGECALECEADTRECLSTCPELERPTPAKE